MSDLSVYWMIIPYFLVGMGECLVSVQLYDMCYNQVPEQLRSTAQAVNLYMSAQSGAIAGAISKAFAGYIQEDLNDSHIEYEYIVAAVLALAALPPFIVCAQQFVYKSSSFAEDDDSKRQAWEGGGQQDKREREREQERGRDRGGSLAFDIEMAMVNGEGNEESRELTAL